VPNLHRQLRQLGIVGVLILLLFAIIGYYIATQKIIAPIELLRSAARMIAASVRIAHAPSDQHALKLSPSTAHLLDQIHRIKTGDEIEDLANDFGSMARRVLSYHEQLEEELAAKTTEMQRDLQIAHEFQEALMPRSYPQFPGAPLRLNFHHEYRAASTVGGDFFDIHKLSDHRAGIFIADVMGHGARSALVTAILRTLLQDLVDQADDPAHFLELITQHFFDSTSQTKQGVFASAFYMVLDTERAIAAYASAGHPPPLLADRTRRVVTPLIERLENNPALGVFRDSTYTNFIKENDLFLLFTDGLFEALNAEGEDFGRQRLQQVIERHMSRSVTEVSDAISDAVSQFIGSTSISDDICWVAVEVAGAEQPQPVAAG
jgi:serine phosphatase RsbU (regulator of sigma subunit)